MECPKCGYMMDAFTVDCPRCARLNAGKVITQTSQEQPLPVPNTSAFVDSVIHEEGGKLICPRCHSEECRKVSMVYEMGTTKGTSYGGLIGSAGENIGGAFTNSQSLLAKRCEPPSPQLPEYIQFWIGLFVADILIGIVAYLRHVEFAIYLCLILIIPLIVIIIICMNSFKYEDKKLALTVEWQKQWICFKCGFIWKIDS